MVFPAKSYIKMPFVLHAILGVIVAVLIIFIIKENLPHLPEKHILIVGNMLAGYNDMPDMLESMLNSADKRRYDFTVSTQIQRGYTLSNHNWKNAYAWKLYRQRPDIVFLQEHSATVFSKKGRQDSVSAIDFMIKTARYYRAAPRLLETWPRGQHNDFYTRNDYYSDKIPVLSPDDMAQKQNQFHSSLAHDYNVPNIPTTRNWQCVVNAYPDIVLYDSDDNYPSKTASYLVALGLYQSITGYLPDNNIWTPRFISDDVKSKLFSCINMSDATY